MTDRAAAARAQPQPARRARAGGLRHRHPRRPRGHGRGGGRARTASTSSTCQSNHEGDLVDAIHGARGRCAAIVDQPRRLHPLRLGAPRRAGRVRRAGRRAAPVQPQRPRAVAPHVGGRARWPRAPSRASAGRATSLADRRRVAHGLLRRELDACRPGRCRRWTSPAAAAAARSADGADCDALLRHQPGQHPLPHRLHRVGRRCCWCCPTSWCSSPTAATTTRPPSSCGRRRRRPGRGRHAAAGQREAVAGGAVPGVGRLGLEADQRHAGPRQRPSPATGSPAPSWSPPNGLVEELRRVKDAGEVARIEAACRHRRRRPGRGAAAAGRRPDRGRVRPRARHRDAPARRRAATRFETIVRVRAQRRQAPRPARRPPHRAAATWWSSTSARWSTATART